MSQGLHTGEPGMGVHVHSAECNGIQSPGYMYIYICVHVCVRGECGDVGMVEDDQGSDKKCGESGSVTGPRLPDRPTRDGSGRCP